MAAVAALLMSSPGHAARVLVDFEDLIGTGLLADGYGGISWDENFSFYDQATAPPFSARSGTRAAFFNYDKAAVGSRYSLSFNFDQPVQFEGAWFSGRDTPVSLSFFREGELVGEKLGQATISAPSYLSGFVGPVDQVRITAFSGFWIMDDLAYNTDLQAAVPEPSTWAMLIVGFGAVGMGMRSSRRRHIKLAAA
jgi:hypothetical protein